MLRKCAVLVDASQFAYRQHYTRRHLSSEGRPTSILSGVPSGLLRLKKHLPEGADVIMVWDGGGETWRHRVTEGTYKANRDKEFPDRKLVAVQKPRLTPIMKMMGIPNISVPGVEADDLLGILATGFISKLVYKSVAILSSDRDFYQLLGNKDIRILIPDSSGKMRKLRWFGRNEFEKEYKIHPALWNNVKALCGDSGDNIPNIRRGIGIKTAIKLVQSYAPHLSLQFKEQPSVVQKRMLEFKKHWQRGRQNYKLVKILTWPPSEWYMLRREECVHAANIVNDWPSKGPVCPKTQADYKVGCALLAEYELNELFQDRIKMFQYQ